MNLKDYRTSIRAKWLPLVGRTRLTPREYDLIAQWFNGGVPVGLVLRAIGAVRQRANVVYSIGVLRADLEALQREQGRLQAGAHEAGQVEWREQWKEALRQLSLDFPDLRDSCESLIRDLPKLSKPQAQERMKIISEL